MNYKEALLFISKCLTITHNKTNGVIVKNAILSEVVDWNNVVRLSTKHYVFPVLYCNFKKVHFLQYLPNELVKYMKYITGLNRERNLLILDQAKEINKLLLANNITPLFLKGTANLLDGLYEDIAERMVGDIDFIVEKTDADKTLKILLANQYDYSEKTSEQFGYIKHYPRMIKKGSINAIEVHLEMTLEKFSPVFNYQTIKPGLRKVNGYTLLSHTHQIAHTLVNKQLNDYGHLYKNIALRNYYDVYLLSFKANTLKSILEFTKIFDSLNSFLSNASFIFPNSPTIIFEENSKTLRHQKSIIKRLEAPSKYRFRSIIRKKYLRIKIRVNLLIKACYSKKHFVYVMSKLTDIKWYQRLLMN
jgi:hypothetical protein